MNPPSCKGSWKCSLRLVGYVPPSLLYLPVATENSENGLGPSLQSPSPYTETQDKKSTNKAVSRKPPGCRSQHASWKVRLLHPLGSDPQVDQGSISPHPPQLWPEERSRDGPLLRDAPASRSPACPLSSSRSEDRCLVCERSAFRVSSGADVILLLRFRLPHPLSRCSEKVCRTNAP